MRQPSNNAICMLCHPFHRGGVTKWMVEATGEFVRKGWDTWFVTVNPFGFISGDDRPTMKTLLENIEGLQLIAPAKSRSFELGTLKRRSYQYAALIMKHVPKGTPVIISDDESVWKVSEYIGNYYPIIGVLHSDDDIYYYLYKKYGSYLSSLVVVSNRIRNKAIQISDRIDIHVIPYGIKLPELRNKGKSNKIRIIWAGRIEEQQKRVSDIPKIGILLRDKNVPFHWIIAGHGKEQDLRNGIENRNLEDYFTFTGWLDKKELYNQMDESDILVMTSNYEGMPLTVIEALSKGLGIIHTRVSGVEDLKNDTIAKDVIRLFEIGDIEDAVKNILKIIEMPSQKRISISRKIAETRYSIQSCIDQYSLVLKKIQFNSFKLSSWPIRLNLGIEILKSIIISKLRYWRYQKKTLR